VKKIVTILLVAWSATAAAQNIQLDGPTSPVQPREYCQILVGGLSDADLPTASIDWSPRDGTTLMPARLWGGQPFLFFSGKTPGRYTITVSVNAWRGNLDAAVDAARRAGTIDAESLTRLVTLQSDLSSRYPLRSGSCDVEIAGVPPTPPPDPPPPVTQIQRALILLDSSAPDQQRALQLNLLRNDKSWSKRIEILNKQTETEDEAPAALVASALQYLAGRPLPRLLGLGPGGAFAFDVDLPPTADAIKQILRDRGME
jgi:hypothetical protein